MRGPTMLAVSQGMCSRWRLPLFTEERATVFNDSKDCGTQNHTDEVGWKGMKELNT